MRALSRKVTLAEDVDLESLASMADGMTGEERSVEERFEEDLVI